MNVVFGFSQVQDFPSMIILYTTNLLFLYFYTPCIVCSPNIDEVNVCFKFFACLLFLMIFVLLFFLFNHCFEVVLDFFIFCSGLFLLYVETYANGSSVLCFLFARSSFTVFFSANSNPYLISVIGYPLWWRVTCNFTSRVCLIFLLVTGAYFKCWW